MRYFTLGKGTISLDFIAAILSLASEVTHLGFTAKKRAPLSGCLACNCFSDRANINGSQMKTIK